MRRRDILTFLGATAAFPRAALAQQGLPMIGFIDGRSEQSDAAFVAAFRRGLAESDIIEGKTASIEFRWADGQLARVAAFVEDIAARKAAVVLAGGGATTALIVKRHISSIPMVFVNGADPVKTGLVDSISRPSGNVTGVSFLATQIVAKRLALLLEFLPKARSIAVLVNPTNPDIASMKRDVENAERALKLQFKVFQASNEGDVDAAFAAIAQYRPDALLIGGDAYFNGIRRKLIALTTRHSLPAIFDVREFAAEGGLMSYGTSQTDAYRQAGVYVGNILKGSKPADLPVIQSTRFELIINVATAKALGLEVPTKLMALADELIE